MDGDQMSNTLSNILVILAMILGIISIVFLIQPNNTEYRAACEAAGGVSTHHGCLVKLEVK